MTNQKLVLRTMYIDPEIDDKLRIEAFDRRTSKNDLLREYLRIGMEAAKSAAPAAAAAVAAKPAAKRASLVKSSRQPARRKDTSAMPAAQQTPSTAPTKSRRPATKAVV